MPARQKHKFRAALINGVVLLVGLSVCLLACSCQISKEDQTAKAITDSFAGRHRCSLDSSRKIMLAKDGKSRAEIVVGTNPCQVVTFAAQELKTFLDQATGADFKIVNQRSENMPAIFLGDCELAKKLNMDIAGLPRDAFVIKSSGQDIVIAGRDDQSKDPIKGTYLWGILYERGTLFGVYDFLERFAGTRFFFPGKYGTVVPKTKTLGVPQMNIYEEPDCLTRRISLHSDKEARFFWYEEQSPEDLSWTITSMNLRCRMQTLFIPNDHGLAARGVIKRWGKSHPEYFALRADGTRSTDISETHCGHLCFSNEGLRKELFEDAKSYLTGEDAKVRGVYLGKSDKFGWHPGSHFPGYFDLGPQDALSAGNWCHCDKCWPYWKNNRQADFIWGMVADIANRLKKENIPGFVTCSAYSSYMDIPNITLPDNIYVSLCVTGPWAETRPELQQAHDRLVIEWSKKCNGRLDLRNYINEYGGSIPKGVPPVSSHLIAQYYQKTVPYINGVYVQANISYALHNQFPNAYFIFKYLWNSKLDINKLQADAMKKLFGPAAKPMNKFFGQLEEIWTKSFAGYIIETPLGPSLAVRSDREVWDTIYTPEVFAEFNALYDEAEKLAADDPDAKMRVVFFREKYLGGMKRFRDAYYALKREMDDLVLDIPPAKTAITLDGKLDDDAWKTSTPVYLVSIDGDDPKVKTAVRVLWSSDTLYLAFDCEEPKMDALKLVERKRDDKDLWQNASVEIFLNPSQDRENYYHFTVDARGVVSDAAVNAKGGFKRDKVNLNWNCDLQAKTTLEKDRWTAEIAIPIKALKPDGVKPGEMWVANFNRSRHILKADKGENQYMSWSPFLKNGFHDPYKFGHIRFADKPEDRSGWILLEGSFEGKISGRMLGPWYLPVKQEEQALIHIDNTTYRDGCQSICIANEKARPDDRIGIAQNLPLLKPDTKYLLTFWIKAENIKQLTKRYVGALLNINWPGRNYNEFWPTGGYSGTFGWTKQGIKFKTPPVPKTDSAKNTAWLNLRLQYASGKVWFDDVRIRKVEEKVGPSVDK